MTPTLAIETGIEPEYEDALQEAAWQHGWEIVIVQNVPFTHQFVNPAHNPLPNSLLNNPETWFHGSIQAAKAAQATTRWQVHAPWHELQCSTYYPILKDRILQHDHLFLTLAELPARRTELWASSLVEDGCLFFRPDGNDKAFTGGCIHHDEFEHGYSLMTFYEPPPDTKIVVARPQAILAEARFLIVNRTLTTGSYYKTGRQSVRLQAPPALMSTAQDHLDYCLAQGYNPAPSWVLDLAQTPEGWAIIEVGGSSCCGLYKCDLHAFVKALTPLIHA